jgi:hypothetical protein
MYTYNPTRTEFFLLELKKRYCIETSLAVKSHYFSWRRPLRAPRHPHGIHNQKWAVFGDCRVYIGAGGAVKGPGGPKQWKTPNRALLRKSDLCLNLIR